ncbi:MAG: OsmC family peroxiredoxin [Deltaproteobacteria bacterium]|nr:MAG: OsmC family peroxiredoxin [Deltaproteobacteria bacterium]TMQ17074.1 MAG: OsmC family peroxiredoxin [Deltaproteobacteria bacterium]
MSKIAAFPHRYTVRLADRQLVAPPRAPIAAGPPPQFGGSESVWSPEELLVAAALECLWTTFEAYARHDALAVHDWSGTGVAVLDKGSPVPKFTSITLRVELVVAVNAAERARRLLQTAEQRCIISNALNVPVTVEAVVRSP